MDIMEIFKAIILTHSLEGCCSIQLSYGTIQIGCKISVFFVAIQII